MHGILHNGSRALIWPKYNCSIPVLNPRNISYMEEIGISFPPPDGWTLEYSDEKVHRILARFEHWVFITTVNAQCSMINRSYDFPNSRDLTPGYQFTDEGIESCLKMLPNSVENGKGKIILEDSREWYMRMANGERILALLKKRNLSLDRIQFLGSFRHQTTDIYFDTFESQSLIDFFRGGGDKSAYDNPRRNPAKRFICLNRRATPHRIITYQEFIRREWLDESYFSYAFLYAHESVGISQLPDRRLLGDTFDPEPDIPRNGFTEGARMAFNDSSYYLVTETLYDEGLNDPWLFLTEKTYRAFLYQIPFIMVGNPGVLRYLQSQGYEVDFDGIGMEYNDSLLPVPELLDRFQDLPIGSTSVEQCRHNYELYWERAIDRVWEQTLRLLDI